MHPLIGDYPQTTLERKLVDEFKEVRNEYKEFIDTIPVRKRP
jgi:hypothetical protein